MLSDARFWRGLTLPLAALVIILAVMLVRARLPAAVAGSAAPPTTTALVEASPSPQRPSPTAGARALPTFAPATPPPLSPAAARAAYGTLAFALRRNGHSHLYALALGSAQPLRLTAGPFDDRDPAWSPDGRYLAFASHRDGNWELYTLDVASGALERVTRDGAFDAHPSWSPDGNWLAFETNRTGNFDIYVTNLVDAQAYQLTGDPAADFAPSWSPDGRHIAYVSWRSGSQDIWLSDLMRADDDQAVNLTHTPGAQEDHPQWSPDGSTLAFDDASSGYALASLLPVGPDGAGGLPFAVGQGRQPAWSPDGRGLALQSDADTPAAAIVLAVPGSFAQERVLFESPRMSAPAWTGADLPASPGGSIAQARAATDASLAGSVTPGGAAGAPASLGDVRAPDARMQPALIPSFAALRARVLAECGWDYLGRLAQVTQPAGTWPAPDDGPDGAHAAARAFDTLDSRAAALLVMREDRGLETRWHVWLQVAAQDGTQGEPLHARTWDFAARTQDDLRRAAGGEYVPPPEGAVYYVDFSELAADYGWISRPAGAEWRSKWEATFAWHFER